MKFLIPLVFLANVRTNALLVHKSGISQYNFYEMNLCIDVCLKHSETVIYKVSQNLIQSNPLREFDYRDLMESKKYLIENCEDPNTFYLGWESANQTDYEFAEKRTVLPQCFLFIKKHPSKKNKSSRNDRIKSTRALIRSRYTKIEIYTGSLSSCEEREICVR